MKLITYIRVSTKRQGESGLGLEGQTAAIKAYAASVNGEIVQQYREVESGSDSDRPQLQKAIAHTKRLKGRLVIAKLDRLARRTSLVSTLTDTKVDFVACDNPHANKFTLHILAAMAEEERDQISRRTKDALAAAKARGTALGSARPGHWQGREHLRLSALTAARKALQSQRIAEASPVYDAVRPIAQQMRADGEAFEAIAQKLNSEGFTTLRGCPWNKMQVARLLSA